MRRTSFLLVCSGLFAMLGAAWAGCYQSSSDCALLLTCASGSGTGGVASSSSSSSNSGTGGTASSTTSTGGAVTSSTTSTSSSGGGSDGGVDGCHDHMKDGEETDVDCGGSVCAPCPQGKGCSAGSDCANSTCVDSFCCESLCTDSGNNSCVSCGIPGREGTCTPVPKGADSAICLGAGVCDGAENCIGSGTLGHLGDACIKGTDCFNGVCAAGHCRLADGDPCVEGVACRTGYCAPGGCAPCTADAQCGMGTCTGGICTLPGGVPCGADSDCQSGACTFSKFCAGPTTPCVVSECFTHFCLAEPDAGTMCSTCNPGDPCPLGTSCNGGTCLAPAGTYCTASASCASDHCLPVFLTFNKCE